jgi:hypothetical protein
MSQTTDEFGSTTLVLSGGQMKVEAIDEKGEVQLCDLFAPLSDGWELLYWPVEVATRADYSTVIRDDRLPTELVPVSQRTLLFVMMCFGQAKPCLRPVGIA